MDNNRDECKADMKRLGRVMIVKPPNYYCGIGIKLINNTSESSDQNYSKWLAGFRWPAHQEAQDCCAGVHWPASPHQGPQVWPQGLCPCNLNLSSENISLQGDLEFGNSKRGIWSSNVNCQDGLVRFATKEYSNKAEDIDDKFRHITNFSVNKGNKDFVYNEKPGDNKMICQEV